MLHTQDTATENHKNSLDFIQTTCYSVWSIQGY